MFRPNDDSGQPERKGRNVFAALLALSRAIDVMNKWIGWLASWAMFLACLISAVNAMSRYTISRSSNFWLEIQWYFFGAMFMLGASYVLARNEHVRVDLIYGMLGHRKRLWLDIICTLLFLIPACLVLGYLTFGMFWESFITNEQSTNAAGLAVWPALLMFPLGFALLFVQAVSELIKRFEALRGDIQVDTSYEKPVQ
jgi:TRAP-type mannitol/chloroaromatic compound transport system permease small subunit